MLACWAALVYGGTQIYDRIIIKSGKNDEIKKAQTFIMNEGIRAAAIIGHYWYCPASGEVQTVHAAQDELSNLSIVK